MKKTLLLSAVLLTGLAINAQTARKAPQTAPVLQKKFQHISPDAQAYFPEKTLKPTVNNTNKVQAPPYQKIGSSINGYTLLVSQSNGLTYNKAINAVMFTHRKGPDWAIGSAGINNSGAIQCTWSSNNGTSWDSTILYANGTNLGRYPSGAIYNPTGNTTPANAKGLVMGPITGGSGWLGNYFSSGPLTTGKIDSSGTTFVGNNTVNTTGGNSIGGRIGFARIDMQEAAGTIWGTAGLYTGDVNGTTAATQGFAGTGLIKASTTDNGATFVWKSDSIKPGFLKASDGSYEGGNQHVAFSPDGQTGYALFLGIDSLAKGCSLQADKKRTQIQRSAIFFMLFT